MSQINLKLEEAKVIHGNMGLLVNEHHTICEEMNGQIDALMAAWEGKVPSQFAERLGNVRAHTASLRMGLDNHVMALFGAIEKYEEVLAELLRQQKDKEERWGAGAAVGIIGGALVAAHPIPGNRRFLRGLYTDDMRIVRTIKGGRFDGMDVFSRDGNYDGVHNGVDIAGRRGDSINAGLSGGRVIYARNRGDQYGNLVIIEYIIDGQPFQVRFAHLDSIGVAVGQNVGADTQIGTMGFSGLRETEARRNGNVHLHMEVRVPLPGQNTISDRYKGGNYVCPVQFFNRLGVNL